MKHKNPIVYNSIYNIEAIIKNCVLLDSVISEKNNQNKAYNTVFMHKMYGVFKFQDTPFIAKLSIEEFLKPPNATAKRLYNLQDIKIEPLRRIAFTENRLAHSVLNSSNISISDLFTLVKAHDKNFYAYNKTPEKNKTEIAYKPINKEVTINDTHILKAKGHTKMLREEFEERVGFPVSFNEFENINKKYMNENIDKDEFCKRWLESGGKKEILQARVNGEVELPPIKRYKSDELFMLIVDSMKKSGELEKAEKILDYYLPSEKEPSYSEKSVLLSNYRFDFNAIANFGGSEGIYLNCFLRGEFDNSGKEYLDIGTFKTLKTDLESMKTMAELGGILNYRLTEFVNQNIECFTPDNERKGYIQQKAKSELKKLDNMENKSSDPNEILHSAEQKYGKNSPEYDMLYEKFQLSFDEYTTLLSKIDKELTNRSVSCEAVGVTSQDMLDEYIDNVNIHPQTSDVDKIIDFIVREMNQLDKSNVGEDINQYTKDELIAILMENAENGEPEDYGYEKGLNKLEDEYKKMTEEELRGILIELRTIERDIDGEYDLEHQSKEMFSGDDELNKYEKAFKIKEELGEEYKFSGNLSAEEFYKSCTPFKLTVGDVNLYMITHHETATDKLLCDYYFCTRNENGDFKVDDAQDGRGSFIINYGDDINTGHDVEFEMFCIIDSYVEQFELSYIDKAAASENGIKINPELKQSAESKEAGILLVNGNNILQEENNRDNPERE